MVDNSSERTREWGTVLQFPVPRQVQNRRPEVLCIPCAHKNHDFKERAPAPTNCALDSDHKPRAWIDGRSYEMVHHTGSRALRCTYCDEEVSVTYGPEERCA